MGNESRKIVSYSLLAILIVVWGASWPIYKFAVSLMPPLLFASVRAFFGGIILLLIAWKNRHLLNFKKNWVYYIISAILNIVFYLGIQTVGLIYLPGGLFSVLVYFQPVLLGILAWYFLKEEMTISKIVGLIIGFIGIIFVSVDGLIIHLSAIGVILALATALSWAIGVVYVKKNRDKVNSFWIVVMQLIIGGGILLIGGLITEDINQIVWNKGLILSLIWGTTAGMAVAQVIYYKLMNEGEASKVGAFTFLVPILSVFISAWFLNESITMNLFFGMLLVGISIYLVNAQRKQFLLKEIRKE
ncbi:DMT family transporter [Lysinibacillus telephonicus]|uniref:DMT family transporter n=1 Tax=Lysinibacillus telephonicus TaxID=1714840 RepID=A0A431UUB4_9BACI|nr:DMT family transporter [Lysinibacillus telephonicus]RTQ94041.1 DMT family transporter [Lysinibacillus telephonicus]